VTARTKKKHLKTAEPIDARQKKHRTSALGIPEVARDRRHGGTWLITAVLVVAIAVALAMNTSASWLPQILPSASVNSASNASSPDSMVRSPISEQLLRGRWLRRDGGYVIEVGNAQPDGRLEAAYFNPRSVNVSRAEWHRSNHDLHVFVELRQANYPGATYKLRYLPATDRLEGDYYQPLYKQIFPVHFVRE
jgi:hypothetical protein